MADKGAKKGQHTHFIMIISWFSEPGQCVKYFNLDTDDCDGSSHDCARAVHHALEKLFGNDNASHILYGRTTDSGDGGTGLSFHRELADFLLTADDGLYLVNISPLHCVQLTLSGTITTVLGQGGKDGQGYFNRNAM